VTGFIARNVTINITIPTEQDLVPVRSVFGWIVIHQHLGFTFNWNLTWAEYKAGFGAIDADFWLGLEEMHLLTSSQPYRLRVELQQKVSNIWFSVEYWSFRIGDELNDKYRLEVSGYSGDVGDALQFEGSFNDGLVGTKLHNGMKFSTYDHDNDMNGRKNCALNEEGGWWFNKCYLCCLTCNIHEWRLNPGQWKLANNRMMIKPQ